ncbi:MULTISPECIES: D-glycero-alpha-D-manno-heptose-1,7-bisphosphate 7-phosphatase [unclassified Desulfurobacterium]|uniref:D-glycero-alpha-D-manno-heptose-1,7-bisphosphate 7-phosphatase n=2 Tax=unclassified Desulfurobacterium TaxID=2639089 RepID=UPI0003B55728|nr:HAD family hydrolase [Desulfurobacterium sp. TC5-1]
MQRAVFLDRDNTLIEDEGYIHEPEKVKLLPGVAEGLKILKDAGFLLIVISNQSGIGRGYFKEEDFHAVNKRLNQLLEPYSVQIDDFFFCPHKPDEGCSCRKPETELFFKAAKKWNINLRESFMIGDKIIDIEAGKRAGCKKSYLVKEGEFLMIARKITGER